MHRRWGIWRAGLLVAGFLVIDVAFLSANLVKLAHGGWFPVLVGCAIVAIMTSWRSGTEAVGRHHASLISPLASFFQTLNKEHIVRVPGTAVFLARDERGAPPTLVHYVKHAHALHQRVILLTLQTDRVPRVPEVHRIEQEDLGNGFFRVTAHFGFMETPHVQPIIEACGQLGILSGPPDESTVFVGHSSVQLSGPSTMATWRKRLFAILNRNAQPAALYYGLKPEQVVEIGVRLNI